MPVNDPIADLLARMRNAQHARRAVCTCGWSKMKQSICELLKERKYLQSVEVDGEGVAKKLVVHFDDQRPPLQLKRVSTPGARKYVKSADVRSYLHGATIAILSTSHGVMGSDEARKKKLGGELLCTVA